MFARSSSPEGRPWRTASFLEILAFLEISEDNGVALLSGIGNYHLCLPKAGIGPPVDVYRRFSLTGTETACVPSLVAGCGSRSLAGRSL